MAFFKSNLDQYKIVEREYFHRFGFHIEGSFEIKGVRPSYFSIGTTPNDVPVLLAVELYYQHNILDIGEECSMLQKLGVPVSLVTVPMVVRLRRAKEWMPMWITKKSIQRLVVDTPFTSMNEMKTVVRAHFAHSRKMHHAFQNVAPDILKYVTLAEVGKIHDAFQDIPTIACNLVRCENESIMKNRYHHVERGPQYEWMIRVLRRYRVFSDLFEGQVSVCAHGPRARLGYLLQCLGTYTGFIGNYDFILKKIRDIDPEYISDFEMCAHDFTIREYAFLFQVKCVFIKYRVPLSSSQVVKLVLESLKYIEQKYDPFVKVKKYLRKVVSDLYKIRIRMTRKFLNYN